MSTWLNCELVYFFNIVQELVKYLYNIQIANRYHINVNTTNCITVFFQSPNQRGKLEHENVDYSMSNANRTINQLELADWNPDFNAITNMLFIE